MTYSFKTGTALVMAFSVGLVSIGTAGEREADQIRSLLIGGKWARHLDEKLFFADGTYESHDRANNHPAHGTWRLQGHLLRMTEGDKTTTHRIISIGAQELEMTFGDGTEGLRYTRSHD